MNQKARTRAALLRAATELVREGAAPSMQEAAERALVSVATAYRYFPSADELWWEATTQALALEPLFADAAHRIDAAGEDPQARLEAAVRTIGFEMLDDQLPYRRFARAALDQWFRQRDEPDDQRAPIREGRRNRTIAEVLRPLRERLTEAELDRLAHTLGLVLGTDAMLALTDGVGLDAPEAKQALLDASRWLLAGALAELGPHPDG